MRKEEDLRYKKLPFEATVKGDNLGCYEWKDGDRLIIVELLDDLDAEHNQYLWLAINVDKCNARGGVTTYQINIKEW